MAKPENCRTLGVRREQASILTIGDGYSSAVVKRLRDRLRRLEDVASRHAAMLREGDHRIKNSLQIVSSMMNLQARNETHVEARVALQAAAARVASIGRIHDALQAGAGEDLVDLGMTLAAMCASLQEMAGDPKQIAVTFDVDDHAARLPAEIAQPIILAVNELVINALRHAFPGDRPGIVRVSLAHVGNDIFVSVADDGIGLPEGYVLGRGFGMNLVRIMANQLRGELNVENKGGTRITIRAPLAST